MPRPSKRSADAAQAAAEAPYRRSEQWNGFVRGDAVRITGIRGGSWRFRSHVEHVSAGTSWVEVDELDVPRGVAVPGGPAGSSGSDEEVRQPAVRRVRAFSEERVLLARRRARRSPRQGSPPAVAGRAAPARARPPAGSAAMAGTGSSEAPVVEQLSFAEALDGPAGGTGAM